MQKTVLIIEDRPDVRIGVSYLLEDNSYTVVEAESPELAKVLLNQHNIDVILLDMNYSLDTTSGEEGLAFLRWLGDKDIDIPVIAMTAWANVDIAVRAMQLGAGDFIEKPWKNQRLLQVISQQLTLNGLKRQNRNLKQQLDTSQNTQPLYEWRSECMLTLIEQLKTVAPTKVAILLTGDNGTGKSEFANIIHQQSSNADAPFVSVNMGAISENLFESEMFGHTKGAFTDAKKSRVGRFEVARGGTLFLDEIANVPLSQQAKLLRVLETGEYEVLGSSQTHHAKVRFICATNADIKSLIASEMFREDLYYRINTIEFRIPSLKERDKDIVPLAEYFIAQVARKYGKQHISLSTCAHAALKQYHWPGNIRELSHLMERAVLLCAGESIKGSDLPISTSTKNNASTPQKAGTLPQITIEQAEKQLIKQALDATEQNIPKAAKLLGLGKSSLYRRLEKYGDLQK